MLGPSTASRPSTATTARARRLRGISSQFDAGNPPPGRDVAARRRPHARAEPASLPTSIRPMAKTKLKVELPDGTELELAEGATGADAAAGDRPRPRQGRAGDQGRRRAPRPLGAARRRRADRDRHRQEPRGAGADPPRRRPRARRGGPRPLARGEDLDRPADRRRLLLRHRVPGRRASRARRTWRGSRSGWPSTSRPTRPSSAASCRAAEAIEHFRAEGQDYKVELIEDLVRDEGAETVTLYRNGPFEDLCRGPHGPSTGRIGAFKLTSLAGAYWRGDETRQMLTRIYGTAFRDQKQLDAAPGAARAGPRARPPPARARARPLHAAPGGARDAVLAAGRDRAAAADRTGGPRAARASAATRRSRPRRCSTRSSGTAPGHWDNYRENMFFVEPSEREGSEERRYALKPMNCPGACLAYASKRHSYRELPLRLAEFGKVSRYEREGVLHGLLRVRAFTQDDAHVYCTLEQVADEVDSICEAIDELYARFGFDEVRVELSTRPEKSIGTDEQWERAEGALREALERQGREYERQPRRGDLLRAQDRLPHHRRARPLLAVRHLPARLLHARALRAHLHRRRQRRAPPGDDPPRPARLDGALRRDPDRAPRGPLPALAGAGAGAGAPGRRPPQRVRGRGRRRAPRGRRPLPRRRAQRVGRAKKIRDAELAKAPYMLVVGDREQEAGAVSVRPTTAATSARWRPPT